MNKKNETNTSEKQTPQDQFAKLIDSDINLTLIILKKWLYDIGENEKAALYLLAKSLNESKFELLFKSLNYLERNIWKSFSTLKLSAIQTTEAEKFIKKEIIRALFEKSETPDPELFDMIINLSNDDIQLILKAHVDLAGALLNLLPPNKLSDFFSTIEQSEVLDHIQNAYDEKNEKDSKRINKLKIRLREHYLLKGDKTFNSKLDDVISSLPPMREDLVYKPLFNNKDRETISRIANKHFPYQLIERLPQDILKNLLKEYPDAKRTYFFASLAEDKREFYLNCLAPPNTPLREVTQMGIDEILTDRTKLQSLNGQQKQLSTDFVLFVRNAFNINEVFQEVRKGVVENWISERLDR